jgi:hypothetical protein
LPKNDPQGLGIAMTYIRRYSISAMLGIVTEEDTDGNVPKDSGKGGQRQKRAPAMQDSGAWSPNSPGRSQPAQLPKLDGITYQEITATDGQVCIVATGNTKAKKELLAGAGFKWNPQRKMWWKYAHAS